MNICICIYIYIYVYLCICIYLYMNVYIYIHVLCTYRILVIRRLSLFEIKSSLFSLVFIGCLCSQNQQFVVFVVIYKGFIFPKPRFRCFRCCCCCLWGVLCSQHQYFVVFVVVHRGSAVSSKVRHSLLARHP